MPEDLREVLEDFPVFALWEFKNSKAGSPGVFEAVVQQSASTADFPWQICQEGKRCPIAHKAEGGGLYITGSKTAFDLSRVDSEVISVPQSSKLSEKMVVCARDITQQVS